MFLQYADAASDLRGGYLTKHTNIFRLKVILLPITKANSKDSERRKKKQTMTMKPSTSTSIYIHTYLYDFAPRRSRQSRVPRRTDNFLRSFLKNTQGLKKKKVYIQSVHTYIQGIILRPQLGWKELELWEIIPTKCKILSFIDVSCFSFLPSCVCTLRSWSVHTSGLINFISLRAN